MKSAQSTVIYAHVRRELVEAKAPLADLVEDVNEKVRRHGGIILANRQFLRRPISMDWHVEAYLDDYTSSPFEQPEREWSDAQKRYFGDLWGLTDPYQYARERDQYDQFCIGALDPTPYLVPRETILALVETVADYWSVDCPCHVAQVVYTSRHRVICMGCGYLYCVLAEPIGRSFGPGIENEVWENAFDATGELVDDSIEIPILDYREVENAKLIWTTDVWDEVSWVINLYARGDEEEIEHYRRGFPQVDDLIAAGWQHVPTPPSASAQLSHDGYAVDIGENSAAAFKIAASAFARSRTDPDALREAVLSAFQATELILKMRLEAIDPTALSANNPTVIERLVEANVAIDAQEQAAIAALRSLRNKLQHGAAAFGYRSTRRLLRATFAFLDRFTIAELDYWIGHVCDREGWSALLQLPSIQENADRISQDIAARALSDPVVEVAHCDACKRQSVIMFNEVVGHCLYCRWEPTISPVDAGIE